MKQLRKLVAALVIMAAGLGVTSCKQLYYQVYDIKSNNLIQKDNSLVYENEDVEVMYNFWGENGQLAFIVKNKTDKDIFIDMNQSFFILNGKAYDYFKNREFTKTTLVEPLAYKDIYSSDDYWPARYYVPAPENTLTKISKSHSETTTVKEKSVICIPANAYKVICEYTVNPSYIKTCNKNIDFPKNSSVAATYDEENSPLKFINRLAYTFSENGKNLQKINNDFYINNVTNYNEKSVIEKRSEKLDCYDTMESVVKIFKIGGPNKFYKTYSNIR